MTNKMLLAGLLGLALLLAACQLPAAYPVTATPTIAPPTNTPEPATPTPVPVQPAPQDQGEPVRQAQGEPAPGLAERISNVRWQWTELHESGVQSRVPKPENYELYLNPDGTFSLRADCSRGGGSYTLEGERLTLGLTRPRARCGPASLQGLFVQWLSAVDGVEIQGERLVLHAPRGANQLVFAPALETQAAGDVQPAHFDGPADVASSFRAPKIVPIVSPDLKVWTLLFSDFAVQVDSPQEPSPAQWGATFYFPMQNPGESTMRLCLHGAMELEPGTRASLSVEHGGRTWQLELPAPTTCEPVFHEFAECDEIRLPAREGYKFDLRVSVERDPQWPGARGYLTIDEIELRNK